VAVTDAGDRDHFIRERIRVAEFDGLTAVELAELTGRSPSAIRQARHRARAGSPRG
jgi:DNA-directed RNA polymerase specialized sigma24 family protein